jgi:WD40 repeat protein
MWLCLLAAVVAGADPVLIPQMGPRGGVTAASFSRDGRWLATGDGTGGIQVWEAETGAQSGALPGHTRDITSVDLSPDGVILVSASEDETVRIWDVAGGELMAELAVEDDSEGPVAFSPDGQYVAVAVGHGRRVTLWHAETGAAVRSFHSDGVWARELRFSADGGELLATGADGAVVWDTATAEQLRRLEADHFEFASAAMGGGELVAAGLERVIRLWDAETGLPGPPIRANGSHAAATSPGGNLVALGCPDGSILFADATSGEWLQQVPGHDRRVNAVAFSPDGRLLASGADDELVVIWDVTTGARRHELTGHKDEISALTFSPDGALLATATDSRDENAVIMWDVESGELVCRLPGCRDVGALAFDSDGARLAVGANRRLRMHDPVTGNLLWEIETHTDDVRAIAFTPDGRALASSDEDRVVLISSADSGALLGRFSVTNSYGRQLSFSEDGSVLSVGQHAILSVWDAQTGRSIRELELPGVSPLGFSGGAMLGASPRVVLQSAPGMVRPIGEPDSPPRGVRISPDGRWLAVAEAESDVRLCDVATGQTVQALEGRGTYGRAGFFSVDGRRVLTSGRDGAAIIWETGSGRRLYTLTGHSTIAMLALLSPDARFLATVHSDGGAHLWDLTAMRNVRMWGVKTAFRSPLTFSPDSRTLVLTRSVRTEPAGDQPASVRKYFVFTDVESGEVIRELEAPERMAGSATLSPDGGRLASAGSQGTVVWDLKTGEELPAGERFGALPAGDCEGAGNRHVQPRRPPPRHGRRETEGERLGCVHGRANCGIPGPGG